MLPGPTTARRRELQQAQPGTPPYPGASKPGCTYAAAPYNVLYSVNGSQFSRDFWKCNKAPSTLADCPVHAGWTTGYTNQIAFTLVNNLEQIGRAANPLEVQAITFFVPPGRITKPVNVELWILPTQCQQFLGQSSFLPSPGTDPLWRGGVASDGNYYAPAAHHFPNQTVPAGATSITFNLNEVPDDFTVIQPEQSNFYYLFMWDGVQGIPYWFQDPSACRLPGPPLPIVTQVEGYSDRSPAPPARVQACTTRGARLR